MNSLAKLLRFIVLLTAFSALVESSMAVCPQNGGQAGLWFPGLVPATPLGEPVGSSPRRGMDPARALKNQLRLLKKGSGTDRVRTRQRLMEQRFSLLDPMLGELKSGNHFIQRQVSLVLMQCGDERAYLALEAFLRKGSRGELGVAALAVGKLGERIDSATAALMKVVDGRHAQERLLGLFALGRSRNEQAVDLLLERLKARGDRGDAEVLCLALGMTQNPRVARALIEASASSRDRVRRAATCALTQLPSGNPKIVRRLLRLCDLRREEDPLVRRLALEGLARHAQGEDLPEQLRKRRPSSGINTQEEVAWVLAQVAALSAAGESPVPYLQKQARTRREEVLAAVAIATASPSAAPDRKAAELAQQILKVNKDKVTRAALLALCIHSTRNFDAPALAGFVVHSDEIVRQIAIYGEVWLRGDSASEQLARWSGPDFKDDVRERSRQLQPLLAADPTRCQQVCGAYLQVLLDNEGLSVGWNPCRSMHRLMIRALGLENALDPRGSGVAPGVTGVPGRARGAAATAATSAEIDLRRHLDLYPYFDARGNREILPRK